MGQTRKPHAHWSLQGPDRCALSFAAGRKAMKFYFIDTHNVVEGAGAAGLAAALKEKHLLQGKHVGLVATGGNVDRDVFSKILQD